MGRAQTAASATRCCVEREDGGSNLELSCRFNASDPPFRYTNKDLIFDTRVQTSEEGGELESSEQR